MARFFSWFACVLSLSLHVESAEPKAPKHSTTGPDWLLTLEHSPRQPHSGQTVNVRAVVKSSITNVVLLYQLVEPGAYIELQDPAFANNWVSLAMHSAGQAGQSSTFNAEVPAAIQQHRRLVRYRLQAQDSDGKEHFGPAASDIPPNRAYFVYDGIPGWKGAIDPRSNDAQTASPLEFPPETMQRVQAYHLLGKRRSIENA